MDWKMELIKNFFKNKTERIGNSPLVKLILIGIVTACISTTTVAILFKDLSKIIAPTITFLLSLILFFIYCFWLPKIESKKETIYILLDMTTHKLSFTSLEKRFLPSLKLAFQNWGASNYEILTLSYVKKAFYNIVFSSNMGDNWIKQKFRKFFFNRCNVNAILIGTPDIENTNDQFRCYCELIVNFNQNDNLNKTEVNKWFDNHDLIPISFNIKDIKKIIEPSIFAGIILLLIKYHSMDIKSLMEHLKKLLQLISNNISPDMCDYVKNLICEIINEISYNFPENACSIDFIDLCSKYLEKFQSIDVLNNKNFYGMTLILSNSNLDYETIKNLSNEFLIKTQAYESNDAAFVANKAFFHLVLGNIEEAEKLYNEVLHSPAEDIDNTLIEIYQFLIKHSQHTILKFHIEYALAFYIENKHCGANWRKECCEKYYYVFSNAPKKYNLNGKAFNHFRKNKVKK